MFVLLVNDKAVKLFEFELDAYDYAENVLELFEGSYEVKEC